MQIPCSFILRYVLWFLWFYHGAVSDMVSNKNSNFGVGRTQFFLDGAGGQWQKICCCGHILIPSSHVSLANSLPVILTLKCPVCVNETERLDSVVTQLSGGARTPLKTLPWVAACDL